MWAEFLNAWYSIINPPPEKTAGTLWDIVHDCESYESRCYCCPIENICEHETEILEWLQEEAS